MLLAIVMMFEMLGVLASKREDRTKVSNECLKRFSRKSFSNLQLARNLICHKMYSTEEVKDALATIAQSDDIYTSYARFFDKASIKNPCREFYAALLDCLNGKSFADKICELIPPSRRSDFPATNDEAALQFAYEQMMGA